MKKYVKQDWILAGIRALTEKGETAIRIEYLCNQLKVSKGSFYHHFENIDQYIDALMKYWEAENTTGIIEETEKIQSFEQKTERLNTLVLEKDQLVEVRIRAWAMRDRQIQSYIDKIDYLRMAYLTKLYMEYGVPEQKATDLAKIEYGALVGMQHLFRDLPYEDFQRLGNLFQQMIKTSIS